VAKTLTDKFNLKTTLNSGIIFSQQGEIEDSAFHKKKDAQHR